MAVFGFIVGIVLGSFVKAASERIVKLKSIRGRSYCLQCKKTLQWYDLLPVLSFLALRGRCRHCHKKIPLDNLLTELVMGVVVALLFWSLTPANPEILLSFNRQGGFFLADLIFKSFLLTVFALVFLIDWVAGIIPDKITYPAAVVSSLYLLTTSGLKSWLFYHGLQQNLLGHFLLPPESNYLWSQLQRIWEPAAFSLLTGTLATAFFFLLIAATRGRGMGWGDAKYVFLLGLALGFPNATLAIFLAFILGAVFALGLIAIRMKHFGQTIPFGPFLSLGASISLIWGPQLISWYLNGFR